MIEYFLDEAQRNRFRVKGSNGEIVSTSEPYSSRQHAQRGVMDLTRILMRDMAYDLDRENSAHTPRDGSDSGLDSRADAEPQDEEAASEAGKEDPLQEGTSRHDEVPGDNSDALRDDDA